MRASANGAAAVLGLTEALEALLCPQFIENTVQPSLLDQLEEATEPSGGLGSGTANVYKSPAALDVVGLLRDIDGHLRAALRAANYGGRLQIPRAAVIRLAVLYASDMHAQQPTTVRELTREAASWAIRARTILTHDPQIIETRAQPCPRCGKRTVFVHSEELGESVQRPSLYLDTEAMLVYCRACSATWGPRMWSFLRRLLESPSRTSPIG
jgi:hypothetical protein